MRRALSILPVLIVASLMVLPAVLAKPGSSAGGSLTGATARPADLSSRAAINRYLVSLGVDPADAVVQRGDRNYAGPDCPGSAWNCTDTSAPVVQLSSGGGGENVFVCDPEGTGTDEDTNTCVISQNNTTGDNHAVCIERDEQEEGVVEQSCTITQTNISGDNAATVRQTVLMDHKETTQRSEQTSEVSQTNGTGDNEASVEQRSDLSIKTHGTSSSDIVQQQDAIQDSDVEQLTGIGVLPTDPGGDNTAEVFQSHVLEAKAHKAASVEQLQNADSPFGETDCGALQFTSPNICSEIDQQSTTGDLLFRLRQDLRHEARAEPVSDEVFQQQGSSETTGGMAAVNHQNSLGVARRFKAQTERQNARAHKKGMVTQLQYTGQGPRLNSDQVFNLDNIVVGDQSVHQSASDPTFQQLQIGAVAVPISGEATFTQRGCQNGECEQQTVTGGPPGVFAELGCNQGEPPDSEGSPPPEGCVEAGGSTGEIG